MGGIVEELNPVKGLKKLSVGIYDFRLVIEGRHEDSELLMHVLEFPTTGTYHIKFTDIRGMDSTSLKDWLQYDLLVFKTDSIEMNMENGTVSILLREPNSDFNYYLENIKAVIRMPKEQAQVTEEDILNNEHYKKAVTPSANTSIFGKFKSLFGNK
ncbi:hypothetical protein VOI54_03860 [Tamlana sp. 2201CG12-4]|uniref:hypothetical protein n=1 Tax=Tamlana sp. 2201CG12-4 TaxID=3112582 RepID=UPI002DBDFDC6|nr:hypothetical protein [Tamlana sp. 2201CG12-4]MEC3906139.1 hypothetical protein [Tamlana sp. 2201CG12-4]